MCSRSISRSTASNLHHPRSPEDASMTRLSIVLVCLGAMLAVPARAPAIESRAETVAPMPESQLETYLAQTATQETPAAAPEPAPAEPWFLMRSLKGTWIGQGLDAIGTNVYGWIQQGFAGNIDSPRDRINYGANLDWRSNDYRLNQVYFVVEKTLQHEDKWNIGYRVDFLI